MYNLFFIARILFSDKGQTSTIVILKGETFGQRVGRHQFMSASAK